MFDVFIGHQENKIDAKGRLSIPSDFRKVIENGHKDREPGALAIFVLVFGDERTDFLQGMTVQQFDRVKRQILRMKKGDPRRKDLEETVFEKSQFMVLDDTGRIVLPPRGRDKLGVAANEMLVFTGRGDTFRIWKPEDHAAKTERPAADPEFGYDPDLDPMDYLDGDEPELE